MKTNIKITFKVETYDGKIVGGYNTEMGHGTMLTFNGIDQEDDKMGNLQTNIPKVGDTVKFGIPSGVFNGIVESIYSFQDKTEIVADGFWDGRFGGLDGGRSCYGSFDFYIWESNEVNSSWGIIPYSQYILIRHLRNQKPEDVQAALRIYETLAGK